MYFFLVLGGNRNPVPSTKSNVIMPAADSAFKALVSARICAAIWSFITDCDETFNYWEPLHYLINGHGLQTWEYSPEFALRSYTYLLIHGVPGWIYKSIFQSSPMLIFYFIRCILGLGCALSEVYFYKFVTLIYIFLTLLILIMITEEFVVNLVFTLDVFG